MSLISSIGKAAMGKGIKNRSSGSGILNFGLGMVAARIATRSVPGAVLVGGAYLAKKLYDKRIEQDEVERIAQSQSPSSAKQPPLRAIDTDAVE